MFKLIPKIISAVMAFIISLMPIGSGKPQQKCSPEFSGTFLQSWMSSSWDDARWQTEIDNAAGWRQISDFAGRCE